MWNVVKMVLNSSLGSCVDFVQTTQSCVSIHAFGTITWNYVLARDITKVTTSPKMTLLQSHAYILWHTMWYVDDIKNDTTEDAFVYSMAYHVICWWHQKWHYCRHMCIFYDITWDMLMTSKMTLLQTHVYILWHTMWCVDDMLHWQLGSFIFCCFYLCKRLSQPCVFWTPALWGWSNDLVSVYQSASVSLFSSLIRHCSQNWFITFSYVFAWIYGSINLKTNSFLGEIFCFCKFGQIWANQAQTVAKMDFFKFLGWQ